MAQKKGSPKVPGSGRKIGSINKRSRAIAACEAYKFDPFRLLVKVANDKTEDMPIRIACAKDLCEYLEPKLSRQEVKAEVEHKQTTYDLARLTSEQLEQLAQLLSDAKATPKDESERHLDS